MSQADGGPAFPLSLPRIKENGKDNMAGMTLRDWFAGMAICGSVTGSNPMVVEFSDGLAKAAYQVADDLLAARENKQ